MLILSDDSLLATSGYHVHLSEPESPFALQSPIRFERRGCGGCLPHSANCVHSIVNRSRNAAACNQY